MTYQNVALEAISAHLPHPHESGGEILPSSDLESRLSDVYQALKLPEGRLELMTGIRERRLWPTKTRPSDIATAAAKKLIATHNIPKQDIELLIHASVCRDFLEPSTASVVHHNLDLSLKATIFDLSNACLGVLSSMDVAAQMIESGKIQRALIVSGENGGPLVEQTIALLKKKLQDGELTRKNIKKYLANLTIGSGGVALSLCHRSLAPAAPKLLGGVTMTDSKANTLCRGDGDTSSLTMETDSEALMLAGVELAKKTWQSFIEKNLFKKLDWVITHQVGTAHEKMTLETLGLLETRTVRTYPELGNTGSAALPLTLHKLLFEQTEQKPATGEIIGLLGIGSGLTSTMMGLQC